MCVLDRARARSLRYMCASNTRLEVKGGAMSDQPVSTIDKGMEVPSVSVDLVAIAEKGLLCL